MSTDMFENRHVNVLVAAATLRAGDIIPTSQMTETCQQTCLKTDMFRPKENQKNVYGLVPQTTREGVKISFVLLCWFVTL
jgi:hypothetical protein